MCRSVLRKTLGRSVLRKKLCRSVLHFVQGLCGSVLQKTLCRSVLHVHDVCRHFQPCRSAQTNPTPGLTLTLTPTLLRGSHAAPPHVLVAFFQNTSGRPKGQPALTNKDPHPAQSFVPTNPAHRASRSNRGPLLASEACYYGGGIDSTFWHKYFPPSDVALIKLSLLEPHSQCGDKNTAILNGLLN